jgi:hypothetical protein
MLVCCRPAEVFRSLTAPIGAQVVDERFPQAYRHEKSYQGNELWTAINPSTGKRQIVDPEGEFIPGETIIKLYYWKRIDGYVTVSGDSLFKVAADGFTLRNLG